MLLARRRERIAENAIAPSKINFALITSLQGGYAALLACAEDVIKFSRGEAVKSKSMIKFGPKQAGLTESQAVLTGSQSKSSFFATGENCLHGLEKMPRTRNNSFACLDSSMWKKTSHSESRTNV